MQKMVIFKKLDGWYMTNKHNYEAYIQDARKVKKIEGAETLDDVAAFIDKICRWYNDTPSNYEIARY